MMPDHFAVLDQPRRPWLDADALKEHFHRASATWHPDVAGSGDAKKFAEVSLAYNALRDPAGRLRHLLELEAPEALARSQAIPPDFTDLFMRLAEFRQRLDALLKKESTAAHGLVRAVLAEERVTLGHRVVALRDELEAANEATLLQLRTLDAEWEPRPPDAVDRLAALHQRFAYLSKWRAQMRESLFKLQP